MTRRAKQKKRGGERGEGGRWCGDGALALLSPSQSANPHLGQLKVVERGDSRVTDSNTCRSTGLGGTAKMERERERRGGERSSGIQVLF